MNKTLLALLVSTALATCSASPALAGTAVTISPFGIPVRESNSGMPVELSTNGSGMLVRYVSDTTGVNVNGLTATPVKTKGGFPGFTPRPDGTVPGGNPTRLTILFVGSSTPDKYFNEFTGPSNPAVTASSDGNTFAALGTTGAGATNFGNRLNSLTGKSVRLIRKGVSGSTLTGWEADGDANRASAVAAVIAAGGVDAIVSIVGFNDAQYSNVAVTSVASHAAKLRSFLTKLRNEIGQPNVPVFIGGSQEYNGTASYVDDKFTFVRAAEMIVAEELPNRWFAHAYDLEQLSDGIHQAAASYPIHAFRGAANVAAVLGGGASVKGPSVSAVTAVYDTTTDVTIAHDTGTDFTPTSGAVTGFALSFDGFANGAQINSATRLSATKVRLLHTASGGAAPSVQLLRGARPDISGVIKDNSTLTLPINPTKGIVTAPNGSSTVDPGVTPTPTPTPTGPLNDTFTDTDNVALSAHVPESGHTWADVNSAFKIIQNAAIGTALGNARSSWAPASSAYGLTANLRFRTDTGNTLLILHAQDDSNYYWAGCVGGARWQIGRTVAGSATVLQNVAATRTAGTSYALDFSITSAGVLTLKVDGATVATATDTTSALAPTGAAGMRQSSAAASTTTSAYFLDIAGYAL